MMKIDFKKYKKDHRHIICTALTLISFAFGLLFPNSLPRVAESLRDLLTSFAFYFNKLVAPDNVIVPQTITLAQEWQFCDSMWKPVAFLPGSWEEFQGFWQAYLELLFDADNFERYFDGIGDVALYGSRVLLALMPVILIVILKYITFSKKVNPSNQKTLDKFRNMSYHSIAYPTF